MKNIVHIISSAAVLLFAVFPVSVSAKDFIVKSPDRNLECTVSVEDGLYYSLSYDGKSLIDDSRIALTLGDGSSWDGTHELVKASRKSVRSVIQAQFYTKSQVSDRYSSLLLDFGSDYDVEFRVYDEGVAWRFVTKRDEPFRILEETAQFNFAEDMPSLAANARFSHKTDPWQCTFEAMYTSLDLSEFPSDKLYYSPVLVKGENVRMVIAESDALGYPGMFLGRGEKEHSMKASFSNYPEKMYPRKGHQTHYIMEYAEDIARIDGPRSLPWRIICVGKNDADLLNNDMVYRLAAPSRVEDVSWIRPGTAVWDYWNNWNGVGKGGWTMKFEDYQKFIDVAAECGVPYYMLDGGWGTYRTDKMEWREPVRLPELVKYAADKGVGIVLWCGASLFSAHDMEALCKEYSEMGVAGFKIDFWDHDNQRMVERMEASAAMAAKYGLVVDFHGCSKPSGFNRTYPNVLTFEGVRGMEYKIIGYGNYDMVTYNLQFPFIRSLAGPADLTPGAMVNRPLDAPVVKEEASIGTRCQQLALFHVTYSPFHCACDSPTRYAASEENRASLELIGDMPTVWDETRVLDAGIDSHIIIARRSGQEWWVSGICGREPYSAEVKLDFLSGRNLKMEIFRDAEDAAVSPEHYVRERKEISRKDVLNVSMAPAGGFVARITKN